MYKYIALTLLTCCPLVAIEGTYLIDGKDPYSNTAYKGKAVITRSEGDIYQATWSIADGEEFDGTGIKSGNSISFVFEKEGDKNREIGLQSYSIQGDTLSGSWVLLNQTLLGSETLIKEKQ